MKNFFFKKALPNSTSFDSTLNGHTHNNSHQLHNHQENNNNSIDKPPQRCVKIVQQRPTTLAPIGPPFGTSQQCHQMQTPSSFDHQQLPSSHQRVSPMSCSSTQGTIGGCAVGNELFEQQHQSGWQLVPFDSVQSPTAAQCHHRKPLLMVPQMSAPANGCSSGHQQPQQMPDFVGTLVQQLSIKDAEMERLRTALRRGRDAAERERERHAEEENAAREQISRMRRRLRTYETELEYAKRLNRQQTSTTTNQTNDNEAMAVAKCEKLMLDHAKMKTEMTQQQRATEEREAAWDRERAELNQTVRSLNNTLEELELELRQREVHGREMQLQLERTVVERDMAQMELLNKDQQHNRHPPQQHHQQQQQKKTTLILPTLSGVENGDPIEGSSATVADDGGGPSLASSSGIDSNSSVTDAKELDTKCLWLARRKLVECRQKVARLIRSAEKTLRGERLGRNDLFASFLSAHDEHQILPNSATQIQLIDDQITQIGALRKEMELLHDKFIILYARGTFEK